MPQLVIESGKFAGRSLELQKAGIIGRGETADLRIPDGKASREHCRVFQQAGSWVVVDLNSRNGIHVNGVKTTRKNLTNGDTITIGETVIAFRSSAAPAPGAAASDVDEIEVDEIDVGGSAPAPVVQPMSATRTAPSQARRPDSASKAKEAAFAAARADSSARQQQAARGAPASSASKGIEVRDHVLQFNRIDPKKASIFDTDLSQHGGIMPWLIWGAGLGFIALVVFGIVKVMGLTAG